MHVRSSLKGAVREKRITTTLENLTQDFGYAVRQLWRSRTFAVSAILMLALGIGANTAIFRVADAVLFRPMPYAHADQLVLVWDQLAKIGVPQMQVRAEDFDAFR